MGISACGGRATSSSSEAPVAGSSAVMPTAGAGNSGGNGGVGGGAGASSLSTNPPSPEESAHWTWSSCGTIEASSPATMAALSADEARVAVVNQIGAITIYDTSDGAPLLVLHPGIAPAAIAFSPDGGALGVTGQGTTELLPVTVAPDPPSLEQVSGQPCASERIGFSLDGKYVLTYGADAPACVWRMDNGRRVSRSSVTTRSAAVRGEALVSVGVSADGFHFTIVTRDFAGTQLLEQEIEMPPTGPAEGAWLSPAGDRVVTLGSFAQMFDVDRGSSMRSTREAHDVAFDYRGTLTRFGDGVFDTRLGKIVREVGNADAEVSPFSDAVTPVALSSDATQELVLSEGNAALRRIDTTSFVLVFAGPTQRREEHSKVGVSDLAISGDGSLLVLQGQGWYAFGLRVAEKFEASSLAWWATAPEAPWVSDLSADGKWLAVSGDNRVLVDAADGHVQWPLVLPPPSAACFGSQLRLSPSGKWAAGESYGKTIDVFAVSAEASEFPTPLVSLPAAGCLAAVAFSRDESLMATSGPELYATDDHDSDWKLRWTARAGDAGHGADDFDSVLNEVRFSPDQQSLLVSRCPPTGDDCIAKLHSVADGSVSRELPELTAPHPAFSSEGHWLVSGSTLLHLPSGKVVSLAAPSSSASIATAIFAPNGDIIAGFDDLSVTRYCRSQ